MATSIRVGATSPLDRILGRAEEYGLVQPRTNEKAVPCSETVKSLEKLLDLKLQLSAQRQALEDQERALSSADGSLVPEIVKNNVLLTLDDMSTNMQLFLDHMEKVIEKKDILANYLQTPFSSDHVLVEAGHQPNLLKLLHDISGFLSQSTATLNTMDWASQFKITDAQLDRKLWSLCAITARCQRYHDALAKMMELYRELV